LRKYIKFVLLFLLAIFIFWFFGRDLDWQVVSRSLQQANPWYLSLAVVIICFGYLLRAKRWQVLLEPITPSSLKELFATTTVGFAAIFLIGRAGEIVRSDVATDARSAGAALRRPCHTWTRAHFRPCRASLFFRHKSDLVYAAAGPRGRVRQSVDSRDRNACRRSSGVRSLIALPASFSSRHSMDQPGFGQEGVSRSDPKNLPEPPKAARLRPLAFCGIGARLCLYLFGRSPLWLSIAIPTWLVLLAFNLPITFSDSIFIMGFAVVSSVVPTPGGAAGAFHTATAASLLFLRPEMRTEDAAAVAIAMHLVYFAPAILFGLYYFAHGDISIERFRSLLSSEHAAEDIESEAPNANGQNNNGQLTMDSGQ
jgi:hypothetical protein